jgi:methyl-accepting chemotaxis protein
MFWLTILASSLILSCVFGLASTIVGKITSSLTTLSNDVATGANLTNSAAQDLATASEALSSGVTEQAASLQETVSSLEEVSAMIKKNADNANGLKSAADSGVQSSQQCESEVKGMMQAMSDIRSSSDAINQQIEANNQSLNEITTVIKQIAEKTKVINDIVFQTKLLSFNASVEAARAGEHGKGFAVVAEEIGNLATMSGGAAQEISSLLESGVNQVNEVINQSQANIGTLTGKSKEDVEAGFARAQACQGALENALAKIKEINEMAGSIATACAEQSQGVGEISVAMNQLDQVTQGNSGSATQVAAVADRLKVQSHKLTQSVRTLSGIVHGGRSKPSTNQLIAETVNFSNANQT